MPMKDRQTAHISFFAGFCFVNAAMAVETMITLPLHLIITNNAFLVNGIFPFFYIKKLHSCICYVII